MQRNTHIAVGLFLTTIIVKIFNLDVSLIIFSAFGAIFPDIDFKKEIRHLHRKLLHNVWAISIVSILISFILGIYISIMFFIGAVSHLIVDSFTPMGIYPLYPKMKPFLCYNSIFKISTGRNSEKIFATIIFILTIIIFIISDLKLESILTFIIEVIVIYFMINKYLPKVKKYNKK